MASIATNVVYLRIFSFPFTFLQKVVIVQLVYCDDQVLTFNMPHDKELH